jgi:hypothetical protein
VVGFTTGSRGEVPGKKENLRQEIIIMISEGYEIFIIVVFSLVHINITFAEDEIYFA